VSLAHTDRNCDRRLAAAVTLGWHSAGAVRLLAVPSTFG
jgi:hypothetical protein